MANHNILLVKDGYIILRYKLGIKFIEDNRNKLYCNHYMDYEDYYNKEMMNCNDVYDKDWDKRIVIRHIIGNKVFELNEIYKDWIKD